MSSSQEKWQDIALEYIEININDLKNKTLTIKEIAIKINRYILNNYNEFYEENKNSHKIFGAQGADEMLKDLSNTTNLFLYKKIGCNRMANKVVF